MDVRPIRTDEDHAWAVREIERLWNADPGSPDDDRLDVLATLVDAYETKRWPTKLPAPVEMIRWTMANNGYTQSDLSRLLGSRSRASEVLARKRPLTTAMIYTLSKAWGVPAEALVVPYRTAASKAAPTRRGTRTPARRATKSRASASR